ncbi:bifunctional DNA-formamidopyrimidine glycosylase/DNA-(apurinic or apyrimidinic site) lyase [Patescibacteria group bacterium]
MPELPEVENIKLQLQSFLVGHRIRSVKINFPKVFHGNQRNVVGGIIIRVRRFAKVLSIDLDNDFSLVIHIKLTGQLIYRGPKLKNTPPLSKKIVGGIPGKHTLVVFKLDKDGVLYYNDVRRFGWIRTVETKEVERIDFIAKLGPEPLKDFTPEKFKEIVTSTRRAIKTLLMDQSKVAGIGNIYANDALWLAKIHPAKKASLLTEKEIHTLFKAIEHVLQKGLETGGASELSFVTPDGTDGEYQKHFLAYGQGGKVCTRCKKEKYSKIKIAGRGTIFCPHCQKLSV